MERGLGSSPQTSHGPPDSVHRMAVSGTRQQAGSCRVSPDLVLEVTLHHFCCITLVTQAALATLGGTYVGGASTRECQSLGTVLKAAHTSVCTQTPRPPDIHPMNRSTPGLPVYHQLPEFTQTHVHQVGDAIQPSHPLLSPSPPAFNLSQHQGVFQ